MAESPVTFTFTGLQNVEAMLRAIPDIGARERVMIGAMKQAAKPIVRQAKIFYRAPSKSGSLSQAATVFRWKKGIKAKIGKYEVHIGPKRSNFTALRRWIAFYKRKVTPGTFTYGIRHAHLYEWGFRRGGRKVFTGTRALQRAGQAASALVAPAMAKSIGDEVRREVARSMRNPRKIRIRP
jgi:hypothetical protein